MGGVVRLCGFDSPRGWEHQTLMLTRTESMAPADLRDLLVTVIAGVKSEPAAKWRKIVGDVEVLPIAMHPRCNWRVSPKGNKSQVAVVEQCVEIVRAEHPYVAP